MFGKLNWQINPKNKLMFAYHDDYYEIPGDTTRRHRAQRGRAWSTGHNPSPNVTFTVGPLRQDLRRGALLRLLRQGPRRPAAGRRARASSRASSTSTPARSPAASTPGTTGRARRRRSASRSRTSPTSSWAAATTSSSACSTTAGGSDYVLGPQRLHLHLRRRARPTATRSCPSTRAASMRDHRRLRGRHLPREHRGCPLNLGVRYDHSKAYFPAFALLDRAGQRDRRVHRARGRAVHLEHGLAAPRLQLEARRGTARPSLKAHYGRYYRGVVTGEFDDTVAFRSPRAISSPAPTTRRATPRASSSSPTTRNLRVDPNFKNPYTDQFIGRLRARARARTSACPLNYVHKRGERYGALAATSAANYEPTPTSTTGAGRHGGDHPRAAPGQRPRAIASSCSPTPTGCSRGSTGSRVQLVKRMSNNWQMIVVVRAVASPTGRVGSSRPATWLAVGPAGNQTTTAGLFGRNPNDFVNTDGRLIGDRPVTCQDAARLPVPGGIPGRRQLHLPERPALRPASLRVTGLGIPTTIMAEQIDGSRKVPDQSHPRPPAAEGLQAGRQRQRRLLRRRPEHAQRGRLRGRAGPDRHVGQLRPRHRVHLPPPRDAGSEDPVLDGVLDERHQRRGVAVLTGPPGGSVAAITRSRSRRHEGPGLS